MLTIRIIEPSRHERILAIKEARFQPPLNPGPTDEIHPPALFLEMLNGDIQRINTGECFVMNEAGKTVAKFALWGDARVSAAEALAEPWTGLGELVRRFNGPEGAAASARPDEPREAP